MTWLEKGKDSCIKNSWLKSLETYPQAFRNLRKNQVQLQYEIKKISVVMTGRNNITVSYPLNCTLNCQNLNSVIFLIIWRRSHSFNAIVSNTTVWRHSLKGPKHCRRYNGVQFVIPATYNFAYLKKERKRERKKERKKERKRERKKERKKERERERERKKEKERKKEREREREKERKKKRERKKERERERKRERKKER